MINPSTYESLLQDKLRLDWLESNPRHAEMVIEGNTIECVFYGISCADLMKLREAIDIAISDDTKNDCR
jgi:hypothetical protein